MTKSIAQTINTVQQMLNTGPASNLQNLENKSASALVSSMQVDHIGGALRTSPTLTRPSNPLQEKAYINQVSKLAHKNAYTEFLTSVQTLIGGSENSQESRLVSTVDEMLKQAKILESNSGPSMRQTFIDKAERVCDILTSASSGTTKLRLEADNRLKDDVNTINTTIKALFAVNRELLVSRTPIKLHDKRDSLIKELAESFDIKVTFGNSGSFQIQSQSSGEFIVTPSSYTQFSYSGVGTTDEILNNTDYPELTIQHFDKSGRKTYSTAFAGGSGESVQKFSGGKWSAWIDLRDNVLPEANTAIKALAKNISTRVNEVHNSGSPYPPKTTFKSSIEVAHNQSLDWGSEFTIFAVDEKGKQLEGGAGKLNPMKINMQTLRTSTGGSPTVQDLIAELNAALDTGPSRERAAIGAIYDHSISGDVGPAPQLAGQYLINNVQLLAHGPVGDPNGEFTFELALQGNSYFGSQVEVIGVQTSDVGGGNATPAVAPLGDFPSTRLEKDENKSTDQAITVNDAKTPNDVARIITVNIRVTGDNGVVSNGTVSFPILDGINPPTANTNTRIDYDGTLANSLTDGFDHPPLDVPTGPHVATAKLVREDGTEIPANSGESGNLVIETSDPSYRLVIQGGDFASKFGFNNFFEFDERTGKLNVNQEIVSDVSKMAIGTVDKKSVQEVVVGDARASASLDFDFGAGDLVANNTITIDGIDGGPYVFTMVAHPGGGGPLDVIVPVVPNNATVLNNLIDAINTHPQLKDVVDATFDGATLVSITAKAAGIGGNKITLGYDLTAGGGLAKASFTGDGGVAPQKGAKVPANFAGGTNKAETSKLFNYNIGSEDKQVLEALGNLQTSLFNVEGTGIVSDTISTLSGLATIVTGKLSDLLNEAQIDSNVAAEVLKRTDTMIKESFGIKREEEYLRAVDLAHTMNALARLLGILYNSESKVQEIIFG